MKREWEGEGEGGGRNQYGNNLIQNRPYVACVASVSARACKESWDESKK